MLASNLRYFTKTATASGAAADLVAEVRGMRPCAAAAAAACRLLLLVAACMPWHACQPPPAPHPAPHLPPTPQALAKMGFQPRPRKQAPQQQAQQQQQAEEEWDDDLADFADLF